MKLTISLLAGFFAVSASAQVYAPQTVFHDPSQRVFPVEAARVMAWRLHKPELDRVTFTVDRAGTDETIWKIAWLDASGASVKQATVRYREAQLRDGAAWFRVVWNQLRAALPATPGAAAGDLPSAFWSGAAEAGVSRLEGLAAGFKIADLLAKGESSGDAARMAGCLAQAAHDGAQSLDSALMARSAAWLCSAEELGGASLTREWAPTLVIAGRFPQAQAAWGKAALPKGSVGWMWNVLIANPPAAQSLGEAAFPENREHAGRVFEHYGDMNVTYNAILLDIADKLWPGKLRERMYDFGSTLIWAGKNRKPSHFYAARAITAWLDTLQRLPAQPGDAADVAGLAEKARRTWKGDDVKTSSPEIITLLNRGGAFPAATPLRPVAVATQLDVLASGWEQCGIQIAGIHTHVRTLAGMSAEGKALAQAWMPEVEGWGAFFGEVRDMPDKPFADSARYELIRYGKIGTYLSLHPPAAWPKSADAHLTRRWLLDPNRGLLFATKYKGDPKKTADLIRRVAKEGGPSQLGALAMKWPYADIDEQIDALGLREEISRRVPASVESASLLLAAKFAAAPDPLAYAQGMERLHWDTGLAFAVKETVLAYAEANDAVDATRFFEQAAPGMTNDYERTVDVPRILAAVALLEGDDERARTLYDTYVKNDKVGRRLAYALAKGDDAAVIHEIELNRANYPKATVGPIYDKLRTWLPLRPALMDHRHADHAKALATFPKARGTLFVQWLLATRAKLPIDEAEKFLQSEDAEGGDELLIAALRKDAQRFEELLTEGEDERAFYVIRPGLGVEILIPGHAYTSRGMEEMDALVAWLRGQMRKLPRQAKPTDLRPPGREWLSNKLRTALEQKGAR